MSNEANFDFNKNSNIMPSIHNHVVVASSKIHVNSYIDPTGQKTRTAFDSATFNNAEHDPNQTEDTEYYPLPHQEPLEDNSNESNVGTHKATSKAHLEKPYQVPNSLRKKFKIPFGKALAPIITPQPKATRGSNVFESEDNNTTPQKDFFIDKIGEKRVTDTNDGNKRHSTVADKLDTLNYESSDNDSNNTNSISNKFKMHDQTSAVYTSRFLDKLFKPSKKSLSLIPELESLEELILSQHEVLTNPIKALGSTNLTKTKTLENKRNSLQLLLQENKTPRSLRIKCKLTTSPQHDSHPDFLRLKNELQQEVYTFISKGTKIITEWSNIYLQLLQHDRCHSLLEKALQILDGLTSFHTDLFGTPLWPSVDGKYITLFLFKAYLSGSFIDTSDITEYLGYNSDKLLLIGAKLLLNSPSDEDVSNIISSLRLTDIDLTEEVDYFFVTETLINFNQILRHTTIMLWQHHEEKSRQLAAALKFKTKMKSLELMDASTATAQAIAKATNSLEHTEALSVNANLRISNLEKWKLKQEQQTNELSNRLKPQALQKNTQKNSKGSHLKESMISPEKLTPFAILKRNNSKRNLVDLTLENSQEQERDTNPILLSPPHHLLKKTHKKHRKNSGQKSQQTPSKKTVHWKDSGDSNSIPHKTQVSYNPYTVDRHNQPVPFFPPPPPPPSTIFMLHGQTPYQHQSQHSGSIPAYSHSFYPTTNTNNFQSTLSIPPNFYDKQRNTLNPFTGNHIQNDTHHTNPFSGPHNNRKH